MDPSEFETLGYIALKKRMKEFVAADADLLKVVEEEMQPGKSAGGKVRVGIELVRIELIFVTWHVFGCTPARGVSSQH